MAFFLKLKVNYLSKMHGYPQFSFWIPRVLIKIYFIRIVLNRAKRSCISKYWRWEIRVSGDAQNICGITIVGTVLKPRKNTSANILRYFKFPKEV